MTKLSYNVKIKLRIQIKCNISSAIWDNFIKIPNDWSIFPLSLNSENTVLSTVNVTWHYSLSCAPLESQPARLCEEVTLDSGSDCFCWFGRPSADNFWPFAVALISQMDLLTMVDDWRWGVEELIARRHAGPIWYEGRRADSPPSMMDNGSSWFYLRVLVGGPTPPNSVCFPLSLYRLCGCRVVTPKGIVCQHIIKASAETENSIPQS